MMIDFHLHTVRRPGMPVDDSGDTLVPPEGLIEIMDRTGIDKGVLLPLFSPEAIKWQLSTNEDILDAVEKYPDRFIPFCNIDPRTEGNTPRANLSRQLLYYKRLGCKGVGEITANLPITDPLVLNLFEHCQACEMPVLMHISPRLGGMYGLVDVAGLKGLERCLKLFPDLIFIGHAPGFWGEISGDLAEDMRNGYPKGPVAPGGSLPRLMSEYPNLYGDISAGSGYNALMRDEAFGQKFMNQFNERLLMGTDVCSVHNNHQHPYMLRRWRDEQQITSDVFENVAWKNAARILKLDLT